MVEKWMIRSFYAEDLFIGSSFLQIINACAKKNRFFS